MRFGPVPIREAEGAIVAHQLRAGDLVLKKGAVVSRDHVARLAEAGVTSIVVARLDPGDLHEDAAAAALAQSVAGPGITIDRAVTGRANLFAAAAGVLVIDAAAIHAANRLDEAVTVATLPPFRRVRAGEMVATVKIIPFAVPGDPVAAAVTTARGAVRVAPFRGKRVAVVSTLLPGLKSATVEKTLGVLDARLKAADDGRSRRIADLRVPHATDALAAALRRVAKEGPEIILIYGASAISDRRDVVPEALVDAGGVVEHLGMPVDPGNLLMLGRLSDVPVIGAPGCARSPRENGFDWVLERLLADLPVAPADLQCLGVGGLLMEIVQRPQPRAEAIVAPPQVTGIVLAAGRATRMGRNKLVEPWRERPLVRHVVEAGLGGGLAGLVVVTGHDRQRVVEALDGCAVTVVHNPAYAEGLSTSLKAGLSAVPATADAVLVLLGDMPGVTDVVVASLVEAFARHPEALAVVPTFEGRRGNPVLLARELFPALRTIEGDVGARALVAAAGPRIVEVPVASTAIFEDIDTPEALAALRAAG